MKNDFANITVLLTILLLFSSKLLPQNQLIQQNIIRVDFSETTIRHSDIEAVHSIKLRK